MSDRAQLQLLTVQYNQLLLQKQKLEDALMAANHTGKPSTAVFLELAKVQDELLRVDDTRTGFLTGCSSPRDTEGIAALYTAALKTLDKYHRQQLLIRDLLAEAAYYKKRLIQVTENLQSSRKKYWDEKKKNRQLKNQITNDSSRKTLHTAAA